MFIQVHGTSLFVLGSVGVGFETFYLSSLLIVGRIDFEVLWILSISIGAISQRTDFFSERTDFFSERTDISVFRFWQLVFVPHFSFLLEPPQLIDHGSIVLELLVDLIKIDLYLFFFSFFVSLGLPERRLDLDVVLVILLVGILPVGRVEAGGVGGRLRIIVATTSSGFGVDSMPQLQVGFLFLRLGSDPAECVFTAEVVVVVLVPLVVLIQILSFRCLGSGVVSRSQIRDLRRDLLDVVEFVIRIGVFVDVPGRIYSILVLQVLNLGVLCRRSVQWGLYRALLEIHRTVNFITHVFIGVSVVAHRRSPIRNFILRIKKICYQINSDRSL